MNDFYRQYLFEEAKSILRGRQWTKQEAEELIELVKQGTKT